MPPRNRPLFGLRANELLKRFEANRNDRSVLNVILAELQHRDGRAAAKLRSAVLARLAELAGRPESPSVPLSTEPSCPGWESRGNHGEPLSRDAALRPLSKSSQLPQPTPNTNAARESLVSGSKPTGEDERAILTGVVIIAIIFAIMYFTSNPRGTPRGGGTWQARQAPRVRGVCTGSPDCRVCTTCSSCVFCGGGRRCGVCAGR